MKRSKQNITAIGVFAVSLVFVFLSMSAEAKAFSLFGRSLSLGELTLKLQTPESIARYMWKNFMYANDKRQFGKDEHWQKPEEFLKNKQGDCEDFALFAQSILKSNGIPAFLLNVYDKDSGHTVCVYMQDGKFNVIDGTEVKKFEAENIMELSEKINPRWEKSAIVGLSKKTEGRGQILKSFEKRMQAHQQLKAFA